MKVDHRRTKVLNIGGGGGGGGKVQNIGGAKEGGGGGGGRGAEVFAGCKLIGAPAPN